MNKKYTLITIATIIIVISIIGCITYNKAFNTSNNTNTKPVELRVSIASSLIHVAEDMATQFEKDNNNKVKIILNSDSSSTLYTQITTGAPADVFMSADQKWTKQLLTNDPGLLNSRYENFTTNSLEIIIAPGNPANITSIADLAKPGVKLVLAAPSVPAGSYANSTIWKIDSTWGNPNSAQYITSGVYKNFNASIYQNVVSYENSVEQVVGKVSLDVGTADAGIVFVSDGVYGANTGAPVTFIQIPAEVNTQGIYGIGIIDSTQNPELSQKFMDYWLSKTGKELLTKYGFNS
ncbi:MAG: molybdate ABC transporter substrate-binding protein [Nitrososphaerota archaeon]|jgi:molybdate transport system substrate-binding protein|uniref:molybdate ABC transporter substrate-binding protein n=1 Tax=Candidatus Bathycorpusculum sp. TaxID=2994959 RepID=UPI0028378CE0|nr:molybdate ABC transporter substrate-binding protein [Candidatus Termiticorpusculum sp.]MCL2257436.1 molybdate ABC transporter substrate-binding protein [Candidatus Termiticorpusculum sp.]MCL2292461.1 molybdate ABC transporter substrate-binding protein [Candidatus Termiticorpusculum sp.]MDR0460485.1 molybdate ABC transporter substrate-binding protein [Nitrososphaerota archaeon]